MAKSLLLSDEELEQVAASKAASRKKEPSFIEDVGRGMVATTAGTAKGLLNLAIGNENSAYDWLDEAEKNQRKQQSKRQRDYSAGLEQTFKDDTKGMGDVLSYAAKNPVGTAATALEQLPTMLAGGVAGGMLAKAAGVTSKIGIGLAAGAGEGAPMAGESFDKTGDMGAAAAAFGIGVVTGLTPGNVGNAIARKIVGKGIAEPIAETAGLLAQKGVLPALARAGRGTMGEGGQEFLQTMAQNAAEQALPEGKGLSDIDWGRNLKEGAHGAVVGGLMGGAGHPVFGEGAGHYAPPPAAGTPSATPPPAAGTPSATPPPAAGTPSATPPPAAASTNTLEEAEADLSANPLPPPTTRQEYDDRQTDAAAGIVATGANLPNAADHAISAGTEAITTAETPEGAIEAFSATNAASELLRTVAPSVSGVTSLAAANLNAASAGHPGMAKVEVLTGTATPDAETLNQLLTTVNDQQAREYAVAELNRIVGAPPAPVGAMTREQLEERAHHIRTTIPTLKDRSAVVKHEAEQIRDRLLQLDETARTAAPAAPAEPVARPDLAALEREAAESQNAYQLALVRDSGIAPQLAAHAVERISTYSPERLRERIAAMESSTHRATPLFLRAARAQLALLEAKAGTSAQPLEQELQEVEQATQAYIAERRARNPDLSDEIVEGMIRDVWQAGDTGLLAGRQRGEASGNTGQIRMAQAMINLRAAERAAGLPRSTGPVAATPTASTPAAAAQPDSIETLGAEVTAAANIYQRLLERIGLSAEEVTRTVNRIWQATHDELVQIVSNTMISGAKIQFAQARLDFEAATLAGITAPAAPAPAAPAPAAPAQSPQEALRAAQREATEAAEAWRRELERVGSDSGSIDRRMNGMWLAEQRILRANADDISASANLRRFARAIITLKEARTNAATPAPTQAAAPATQVTSDRAALLRDVRAAAQPLASESGRTVNQVMSAWGRRGAASLDNMARNGTPAETVMANAQIAYNASGNVATSSTALQPLSTTPSFSARARALQGSGALAKLGRFWNTVMGRAGARTLTVDTTDMQIVPRASEFTQAMANDLAARYNRALRQHAEEWARANNQTVPPGTPDAVSRIRVNRGGGLDINVRGLNQRSGNPYLVNMDPRNSRGESLLGRNGEVIPGEMSTSGLDGHIGSTGLEDAPGSSDLGYRIAANVAELTGVTRGADSILSTNNNLRRQVQSLSASTLFSPNAISPLTTSGSASPQGISRDDWNRATTTEAKIGLNLLRFMHSVSRKRGAGDYGSTLGTFVDNLQFRPDGTILAVGSNPDGWANGTVVTEAMLANKIATTRSFRRTNEGGVGLATAKLAIVGNTALAHLEAGRQIPSQLIDQAAQMGKDMGGWLFSENYDALTAAPITREQAEAKIGELLGKDAAKLLLDSGAITLVDSMGARVQGATNKQGQIILALNKLTPESLSAVLQHEGLHATLKALVGETTYTALLSRLEALLQAGRGAQWVQDANARVPANTKPENRTEEIAAYAVELSAKEPESKNPLVRWAKDFMSAIRTGIITSAMIPEKLRTWAIKNIQPQDLAKLAVAGLRAKAAATEAQNIQTADIAETATMNSERDFDAEILAINKKLFDPKTSRAEKVELNNQLRLTREAQIADEDAAMEAQIAANKARALAAKSKLVSFGTESDLPGSVSVQGVHFSSAQRAELDTKKYGTGTRGAEAERLQGAENDDIRPRAHFYVDEGNGVFKEPGVGGYGHMVKLNNIYDLRQNPLKLQTKDSNALERELLTRGYDGYYSSNWDGKQGAAVVLGDKMIPTEKYVQGTNKSKYVPPTQDHSYAQKLRVSGLPAGAQKGSAWAKDLKGTGFDTPNVMAALVTRQNERIYRDDLARFDEDQNRYSIAEEVAVGLDPIGTNLLIIRNEEAQGPLERMSAKVRRLFQNSNVTLERIQKLAGITREHINMDAIGAINRLSSKLMVAQKELILNPLAHMENQLTRAGFSTEDARRQLDNLLIARHVPEYNNYIAQINPAKFDDQGNFIGGFDLDQHPGSSITNDEAELMLDAIDRLPQEQRAALANAEKTYRKMITDMQEYALDRGLAKQSDVDGWNERFPNYTPFSRDLNLVEDVSLATVSGNKQFSLRAGVTRHAMGSSANIVSPTAATALWAMKTTTRGENSIVARAMLALAENVVPNYVTRGGEVRPMWHVDDVPDTRVIRAVNVYHVMDGQGNRSQEFYNRDSAEAYSRALIQRWSANNPGQAVGISGIRVDRLANGPHNRVFVQPVPNYLNEPNVMVIPVNGENRIIRFDDQSKDAMHVLNGLTGEGLNTRKNTKVLVIPRAMSRWVMATSTGYNPVFMFFNAARDIIGARISSMADKVPGWDASDANKVLTQFPEAFSSIRKELAAEFRNTLSNAPTTPPTQTDLTSTPAVGAPMSEWMNQMKAVGGATGVSHSMNDMPDVETQMRRLFGEAVKESTNDPTQAADWLTKSNGVVVKVGDSFSRFGEGHTQNAVGGWVSRNIVSATARMNEAAELATRTILFKQATQRFIQDGKTPEQAMQLAALISKNATTNFNMRGDLSGIMNALWPFFNASMQGSARLAQVIFEKETYRTTQAGHPVVDQRTKLTPFGKKVVGGFAGIGMAQSLLLMAAGYDDDDVPDYIKNRAFIVPLPGGSYVAIPMPHGFNIILNVGRELTNAASQGAQGEGKKAMGHMAKIVTEQALSFNPMGSTDNWLANMAPALMDPAVGIAMNKDAFGRTIAREDFDPRNPTPGFTRTRESTNPAYKAAAEWMNTLSGGNDQVKGAISPTPEQIEYVMGTVWGGIGREVAKIVGGAVSLAKNATGVPTEEFSMTQVPVLGRVLGSTTSPEANRAKIFNASVEANVAHKRYEALVKEDTQAAKEYKAENPLIPMRERIAHYNTEDAKLRKERDAARKAGNTEKVIELTEKQRSKEAALRAEIERVKATR